MVRVVFGMVAPAETFLDINGLGTADVCAARSFPSIKVLRLVLRHLFLESGVLLDETGRIRRVGTMNIPKYVVYLPEELRFCLRNHLVIDAVVLDIEETHICACGTYGLGNLLATLSAAEQACEVNDRHFFLGSIAWFGV